MGRGSTTPGRGSPQLIQAKLKTKLLEAFASVNTDNMAMGDEFKAKALAKSEVYKEFQNGTASKENFMWNTTGKFDITDKPDREPDYTSYSGGKISSQYWYTPDGVIRGSNHWGNVASCDWFLGNKKLGNSSCKVYSSKQYGKISYKDLIFKTKVETIDGKSKILNFNNIIGKETALIDGNKYHYNAYTLKWTKI